MSTIHVFGELSFISGGGRDVGGIRAWREGCHTVDTIPYDVSSFQSMKPLNIFYKMSGNFTDVLWQHIQAFFKRSHDLGLHQLVYTGFLPAGENIHCQNVWWEISQIHF